MAMMFRRNANRSQAQQLSEVALRLQPATFYYSIERDGQPIGAASSALDTTANTLVGEEYFVGEYPQPGGNQAERTSAIAPPPQAAPETKAPEIMAGDHRPAAADPAGEMRVALVDDVSNVGNDAASVDGIEKLLDRQRLQSASHRRADGTARPGMHVHDVAAPRKRTPKAVGVESHAE